MFARTRLVGIYSVAAAAASLVVATLLGLAYFATSDGAEALESGTVSAWADPAREAAGALLTFADADRVYSTYLQAFALLFPAVVLSAWVARATRRQESRRLERWGWRVALTGYVMLATGVLAVGLVLVPAETSHPLVNILYLALVFPGIILGTTGSTTLGIGLLRTNYRPRLTAWLLALAFPLWVILDWFVGHNSLGLVPLMLAWAATGLQLAREPQQWTSAAA